MNIPKSEIIDGDDSLHDLSMEIAKARGEYIQKFRECFPQPWDLRKSGSIGELYAELESKAEELETSWTDEPRGSVARADTYRDQQGRVSSMVRDVHYNIFYGHATAPKAIDGWAETYKIRILRSVKRESRIAEFCEVIDRAAACLRTDLLDGWPELPDPEE